jgi:NAD(P)-dependent dehydrogenase (short-subunit alcohol dehydrogenase family)
MGISKTDSLIIVTGSANGIGNTILNTLDSHGYIVHGVDKITTINYDRCDIRYQSDIDRLFRTILPVYNKPLRVLINCAGVNKLDWFNESTNNELRDIFEVNFWGAVNMTREFLEVAPENSIVINIGSVAASVPMRGSFAYNCSKAALEMATLQLAREYSDKQVCICNIKLGKVAEDDSEMSKYIEKRVPELRGWTPEQAKAYESSYIYSKDRIKSVEVAEFIKFIMESSNPMTWTGSIIPFSGGQR